MVLGISLDFQKSLFQVGNYKRYKIHETIPIFHGSIESLNMDQEGLMHQTFRHFAFSIDKTHSMASSKSQSIWVAPRKLNWKHKLKD
jgi:hypothetical protein